jgi:hypothetical protein
VNGLRNSTGIMGNHDMLARMGTLNGVNMGDMTRNA